jgi:hypothetical protein
MATAARQTKSAIRKRTFRKYRSKSHLVLVIIRKSKSPATEFRLNLALKTRTSASLRRAQKRYPTHDQPIIPTHYETWSQVSR